MLGKFLIKVGTWMNKRFPEKMSTDEVYAILGTLSPLAGRIDELERVQSAQIAQLDVLSKIVTRLESENTALKAASALRVRSTIPMPGR